MWSWQDVLRRFKGSVVFLLPHPHHFQDHFRPFLKNVEHSLGGLGGDALALFPALDGLGRDVQQPGEEKPATCPSIQFENYSANGRAFSQPRAAPWGAGRMTSCIRPNGPTIRLASRRTVRPLDRKAVLSYYRSAGRCPGLGERMLLRSEKTAPLHWSVGATSPRRIRSNSSLLPYVNRTRWR